MEIEIGEATIRPTRDLSKCLSGGQCIKGITVGPVTVEKDDKDKISSASIGNENVSVAISGDAVVTVTAQTTQKVGSVSAKEKVTATTTFAPDGNESTRLAHTELEGELKVKLKDTTIFETSKKAEIDVRPGSGIRGTQTRTVAGDTAGQSIEYMRRQQQDALLKPQEN